MSSLSERLFDAKESLKNIQLRHNFRDQKTDMTRMYLLEEHVATIAGLMQLILEAHEKGVL